MPSASLLKAKQAAIGQSRPSSTCHVRPLTESLCGSSHGMLCPDVFSFGDFSLHEQRKVTRWPQDSGSLGSESYPWPQDRGSTGSVMPFDFAPAALRSGRTELSLSATLTRAFGAASPASGRGETGRRPGGSSVVENSMMPFDFAPAALRSGRTELSLGATLTRAFGAASPASGRSGTSRARWNGGSENSLAARAKRVTVSASSR